MNTSIIQTATKIVQKAGKKLLDTQHHHQLIWNDTKFQGYKTFKAKADLTSEKIIINSIKKDFPNHAILSEESEFYQPNNRSQYTWVIDPLHDTISYIRGNTPEFSITLAVVKNLTVICSVLFQPILNRIYVAIKNKGAFLNNQKILVSKINNITKANLSIQHNTFKYGAYQKIIPIIKQVRRMYSLGSAMLPELSAGKVDIVISYKQALYDYVATKLLVEEAGGLVTQDNGRKIPVIFDKKRRYNIVASNGLLHQQILEKLK